MNNETRGLIEKQIDTARIEVENLEDFQEITPIENEEEFLLGYFVGYLRR